MNKNNEITIKENLNVNFFTITIQNAMETRENNPISFEIKHNPEEIPIAYIQVDLFVLMYLIKKSSDKE